MSIIKSALFIDFDNIFLSLENDNSKTDANRFATKQAQWLQWFEAGEHARDSRFAGDRALLIRRCYGSPSLMTKFRPYFTRAGFQTVDCPPLTSSGKNSADIVMVIDIIDAIHHATRFDEFIILSSDSDFTPMALRLRAFDRITSILANAQTAAAFKSCCDVVIDMEDFTDFFRTPSADSPAATPRIHIGKDNNKVIAQIKADIKQKLSKSERPANLAELAGAIRKEHPESAETNWFNYASFIVFIRKEVVGDSERLKISDGNTFLYDCQRHEPPQDSSPGTYWSTRSRDLPEPLRDLAERLNSLVGLPLLRPEEYRKLFDALSEQTGKDLGLTEFTRKARDTAREGGDQIPRSAFAYVGSLLQNQRVTTNDKKSADEIRSPCRDGILHRCKHFSQVDLTPDENDLLDQLLGCAPKASC